MAVTFAKPGSPLFHRLIFVVVSSERRTMKL
jgi:hypothetical protein